MSAIRDGQLVGTESLEEHLANCRQILWSLREQFERLEAPDWLADVNAVDARIVAALAEYAREHVT